MSIKNEKYDVAVVGAGPAGMMAAIGAARNGANVVLVEKNQSAGKKLLLTGGGRCNLCNAEFDLRKLIANYGKNGSFLFHAFSEFGPKETIEFFNDLGVKTKIENNGRVFPKSGKAQDVLSVLLSRLNELNVEVRYVVKAIDIKKENSLIGGIILENGDNIVAKNYVIATGGKSYSGTGSSGDGYQWAARLGHKVDELSPALAPIKTKELWVKDLSGVTLKDAGISVLENNKKIISRRGELLFTHFGLSGPVILNISGQVAMMLKGGNVAILLDFFPDYDFGKLEKEILKNFQKNPNREMKNCLTDFVCAALTQVLAGIAQVDLQRTANDITKQERRRLIATMKNLKLNVDAVLPLESGMVTNGGVNVSEIDHKTMRSKIIANLYFAGEIINVHGGTGGFNLLQSWSTGRLAGTSAARGKNVK